jgi:hypothetical protein
MKKFTLDFLAALAIVFLSIGMVACSKDDANLIDSQVVEPTIEVRGLITNLQQATSDEARAEILNQSQWLTRRLVSYARELHQIPDASTIDSVVYYYGSAKAQAENKNRELFKGKITDQLVGFIYYNDKGKQGIKGIIVYCQNGTFGTMENLQDQLSRVTTGSLEFIIEKGQGINRYVDYQTAINLAEHFNIDLYYGKIQKPKYKIDPTRARALEDNLAETQVTARVYTGDYFNLSTMQYIPAHLAQ